MVTHSKNYRQRFLRHRFQIIKNVIDSSSLSKDDKAKIIYLTIVTFNKLYATDQDRFKVREQFYRHKLIIDEMLGLTL